MQAAQVAANLGCPSHTYAQRGVHVAGGGKPNEHACVAGNDSGVLDHAHAVGGRGPHGSGPHMHASSGDTHEVGAGGAAGSGSGAPCGAHAAEGKASRGSGGGFFRDGSKPHSHAPGSGSEFPGARSHQQQEPYAASKSSRLGAVVSSASHAHAGARGSIYGGQGRGSVGQDSVSLQHHPHAHGGGSGGTNSSSSGGPCGVINVNGCWLLQQGLFAHMPLQQCVNTRFFGAGSLGRGPPTPDTVSRRRDFSNS